MKPEKHYSASASVAQRARCLHSSYRTADGRYIISERDVRAALPSMTPEEYATGFDIIEVTVEEAQRLIAQGGYKMGPPTADDAAQGGTTAATTAQEPEETPTTVEEQQPADDIENTNEEEG